MKILFLVPPKEFSDEGVPDRLYGCSYGYDYKPSLHLLLLATIAEQLSRKVRLLDCVAEGYNKNRFLRFIKSNKFDYVCFFTVYVSTQIDLLAAALISKEYPKTRFIFTGAAPTWKPEQFLTDPNRVVIRGEAEGTLKELLSLNDPSKYEKIRGLSFNVNGKISHNEARDFLNIDTLPIPNRKLLRGRYRVNRLNVYPVTAACFSRGCAFKCTFCAPMAVDQAIEVEYKRMQKNYRRRPPLRLRSAEKVVEEFRQINELGYKGVEVCDNEFVWGKKRTLEICEGIKDLGLEWLCLNRAPAMHDDETLQALKKAGCKFVYMGTESFNQRILDDFEKKIKVDDIYLAVKKLREHGIEPEIAVLMGASSLENKKTILHSIKEARRLKTRFVHYGVVTPFPNTEFYEIAKMKGWLKKGDYIPVDMLKEPLVNLPQISGEEMMKMAKRAYFAQYLSLEGVVGQIRKIRSIGDLFHKLRMFLKFLRYLAH